MKKRLIASLLLLPGLAAPCGVRLARAQSSSSQAEPTHESWRKDFDEVCSKTEDAMTFSPEQLTELIRRCDGLTPEIEKLEESQKKVYLGRLKMCRGLYAYVLQTKANDKK